MGPVGDKVEEWTLKRTFIETAKFSDMDYTGEDLATVDLTLGYDYKYYNTNFGLLYFIY